MYLLIPLLSHIYLYIYVLTLVRMRFSDDEDSLAYYWCFGRSNLCRLIYVEYMTLMVVRGYICLPSGLWLSDTLVEICDKFHSDATSLVHKTSGAFISIDWVYGLNR